MNNALKTGCLIIYLLAIMVTTLPFPSGPTLALQYAALLLLVGHLLEVIIAMKHIRRYPGNLLDSIALTLLFGFLHWKPLKQKMNAN